MEDEITKIKQDIDELKKIVFDIQERLNSSSQPSKPPLEFDREVTDKISDLKKEIYESLNGETLILAFNLKGFCVINNYIVTHETGFMGIGSLMKGTIFFVPSEKAVENRKCPEDAIEKFFSIFSNKQRISLMRAMIGNETMTSIQLREKTGLTEGQFYHHIRELFAADCIVKKGQDQYKLSDTGKILLLIAEAVTNEMIQPNIAKRKDLNE